MARGGRFRGRGGRGRGGGLEPMMDAIAANTTPPFLINGILTVTGNQIAVMSSLDNFNLETVSRTPPVIPGMSPFPQMPPPIGEQSLGTPMLMMQPINPILNPMSAPVVNQLNITVVGNKVSSLGFCCMFLTIMLGSCLIIPLFFMCCGWWKRCVYPQYEVNPQFYRCLGRFLQKNRQCTNITLTVADNAFDKTKANILYESFQGTQLTGFTFVNRAVCFNYQNDQASDFIQNMTPIKSLPFTSNMTWADNIL